jgi:Zn-dependent M28 family amino/carboxypeptidase
MQSLRLAALVAVAFAGASFAQPPRAETAAAPVTPPFSADRFKAHVAFLADDALEGRDTGSRGYDVAAAYVASQFLALGLQPGGDKGSWYQSVPFRSASLVGAPSVTIFSPAGEKSWDNGTDILVRPSTRERKQDVTAPVVFVGYGLDAPGQGLNDYKGLDVRGKIVAVLAGMPLGIDSEIAATLGDQKEAMAAKRGAVGYVTLATNRSAKVRPWRAAAAAAGRPMLTWVGKDGKAYDEAPGLRVSATLNDPAAEALFAGAKRSLAEVRAEADRPGVRPKGFPLKSRIRIQRESAWATTTSPNVVGILPGSDPKLRDEYVILMGHLDHLGTRSGGRPGDDILYNGALDNAAGIGTMLEAARAFAESGTRPRRSVMFIANAAEEKGLLGASYFANQPTVPVRRIAGAVNLDMPLLLYRFTDVIAFGAEHSTVGEAVRRAAARMGIALSPDPMPEQNIFVRSDHYEFVRQGVPAIMLATGYANGGKEKWDWFFANAYHKPADDLGQPIDWAAGARYAQLNYLISRELADADERPRWYKGDYFGDLFAPGAPRAARPASGR